MKANDLLPYNGIATGIHYKFDILLKESLDN
jgi:hypothetical protein